MINIFNLFLFLLALWILFMTAAGNISWLYIFFGIGASAFVAAVSFRLKLIEKKSELLYLSFGFYRHFFRVFVGNFVSGIKLIFSLVFSREPLHPIIYSIDFGSSHKFNPALLMASFNMTTGLFCIGMKDQEILVHAIDEDYFKRFNLQKTYALLDNVNDDNLV
jgi:multisubunit Na+/H+ antiporter MnhE subunit